MKYYFYESRLEIVLKKTDEEKILLILKKTALPVDNILFVDGDVRLIVKLQNFKKFLEIATYYDLNYQIERKYGPIKILDFIVTYKSFFAGMAIFFLLLQICSVYIWNVEYDGNYTISDEQLSNYLRTLDIDTGVKKSKIDCNGIEADMRKTFDNVTWVCAEIKGTNLIIHVKENYNKVIAQTEEKPYDLTAKHNSQIYSIVTRKGTPCVKKGDVVKEGDVLISGVVETLNEYEETVLKDFVTADGDVVGKTIFYYEDSFALEHEVRNYEENDKTYYYIDFFGYNIGWELDKTRKSIVIDNRRNLKLLGHFYIPVSIGMKKQNFYESTKQKYTKEEAIDVANEKIKLFLESLSQKEMQVLENNVKIYVGNQKCEMKGTIVVLESLSKVSPINDSEEGTTTVNERD